MSEISDRAVVVVILLGFALVCLLTVVLPFLLQVAGLAALVKHLLGS